MRLIPGFFIGVVPAWVVEHREFTCRLWTRMLQQPPWRQCLDWANVRITTRLIVLFHKSQDTLLHPGLNDQIQNTLFTEDPHVTRALWVGLIDCQAQRAPTLIGQRWSTISASTGYPRLNPLWLVTHCTLSHAHHIFQSHIHLLACMEMAKFLCAIFNWLKLLHCNGVTSPKPLS